MNAATNRVDIGCRAATAPPAAARPPSPRCGPPARPPRASGRVGRRLLPRAARPLPRRREPQLGVPQLGELARGPQPGQAPAADRRGWPAPGACPAAGARAGSPVKRAPAGSRSRGSHRGTSSTPAGSDRAASSLIRAVTSPSNDCGAGGPSSGPTRSPIPGVAPRPARPPRGARTGPGRCRSRPATATPPDCGRAEPSRPAATVLPHSGGARRPGTRPRAQGLVEPFGQPGAGQEIRTRPGRMQLGEQQSVPPAQYRARRFRPGHFGAATLSGTVAVSQLSHHSGSRGCDHAAPLLEDDRRSRRAPQAGARPRETSYTGTFSARRHTCRRQVRPLAGRTLPPLPRKIPPDMSTFG